MTWLVTVKSLWQLRKHNWEVYNAGIFIRMSSTVKERKEVEEKIKGIVEYFFFFSFSIQADYEYWCSFGLVMVFSSRCDMSKYFCLPSEIRNNCCLLGI